MSNKPEVPQKPRHLPPPPVPLRTNKPQQQSHQQTAAEAPLPLPPGTTSTGGGLDSDYPMNPTWFFHSPPSSEICGSLKQNSSSDWIKERTKAAVDLPPKLCLKSVPVLPVRPSNQQHSPAVKSPPVVMAVKSAESSSSSSSESSSSSAPRRDLNFTKEIKSRCSQRLTERLPPQVHYNSNVSTYQ